MVNPLISSSNHAFLAEKKTPKVLFLSAKSYSDYPFPTVTNFPRFLVITQGILGGGL